MICLRQEAVLVSTLLRHPVIVSTFPLPSISCDPPVVRLLDKTSLPFPTFDAVWKNCARLTQSQWMVSTSLRSFTLVWLLTSWPILLGRTTTSTPRRSLSIVEKWVEYKVFDSSSLRSLLLREVVRMVSPFPSPPLFPLWDTVRRSLVEASMAQPNSKVA